MEEGTNFFPTFFFFQEEKFLALSTSEEDRRQNDGFSLENAFSSHGNLLYVDSRSDAKLW